MSNALAIATVTATLAQVVRRAAQSAVNGADVVLYNRPELPDPSAPRRIHLYLYAVTPNAAYRNNDLPSRSADGVVVQRPQAAFDLHYLIAFYGSDLELEPQRMLGAVVRDLHAYPFLQRDAIRAAIGVEAALAGSNLAEAVDLVKITPTPMSLEELSKLWSVFFQTPYALSVAYQASLVLIESEEIAQPAFPVLRRGEEDRGVDALIGPFPSLQSAYFGLPGDPVLRRRPPSLPAAQLGLAVIAAGSNLGGETVLLRFTHPRLGLSQDLPVEQGNRAPNELKVVLPEANQGSAQVDWAPGVYTVTAVTTSTGSDREHPSNALPIAFSPRIAAIEPANPIPRAGNGTATITVTCQPRVRPEQQVVLLLAGQEEVGSISPVDPDKLVFVIPNAPLVADESIRIRVDGIESMPFQRVDVPPPSRFEFDNSQKVTIV